MEIFTPPPLREKRPPGRTPKHTPEFQVMVARTILDQGMSYREAAKTFKVSHGAIYTYIKKYREQGTKIRRNERTSKYKEEIENYRHEGQVKELKHQIAELYLENLMLKKALTHSVRLKKENSSVITSESLEQLQEDAE